MMTSVSTFLPYLCAVPVSFMSCEVPPTCSILRTRLPGLAVASRTRARKVPNLAYQNPYRNQGGRYMRRFAFILSLSLFAAACSSSATSTTPTPPPPAFTRAYVVQRGSTVDAFDLNGNAVTLTGTFAGLTNPYGIAFDPQNGFLYVVEQGANDIKVFDRNGIPQVTTGTFAGTSGPAGIAYVR